MMQDKLADEAGRLAALDRYAILDTAPEEPFDKITALVRTVLNVPMAAVSLIAESRQWLKSCPGLEGRETSRDTAFCHHTIMARVPLVIGDTNQDGRFSGNPVVTGNPFIRSYLGIPLSSPDGYNLGALCAMDTKPRSFDPMQIEIMRNFAALVMDEMELRLIARTDFLTGALTRRATIAALEMALLAHERERSPATLLLFDIDHFKRINDGFGHEAGDRVLAAVSRLVAETIPSDAQFGRLGGEEFGVLLPGDEVDRGVSIAEDLRARIASLAIEDLGGWQVTASFGVAAIGGTDTTPAAWLAAADHAMYRAKQAGRNRCEVASG